MKKEGSKEIRDYLHLYDCDCIITAKDGNEGWTYNSKDVIIPKDATAKLVLRPLSDILNTEAFEVYKRYFEKETTEDWSGDTGSAYFNPKQVRVKAEHAIRIFNGEDWEQGDFMKVCSIVPYLLKHRFDIFGLIESGLAIDATTLNTSSPHQSKTSK